MWQRWMEMKRGGAVDIFQAAKPHGGGKGSPPPPDYGPLATASRESAQIMAELGREQLGFARQQYNELNPMLREIAAGQQQAQQEQLRQAQDYYNYQTQTFRPVEQGLVRQAQAFNTEAYRNQLASQAAADAGRAFGLTQAANQRAMASMGVNPNSGRFAALQNQGAVSLAAQRAAAMTGTRQQAEQMGWARQMDVTGLGRGLAGASSAAYGGATGAGSAAGQTYMAPGNQFMAGMSAGANTIGSGLQMQNQGFANILSSQTSAYNTAQSKADPFSTIAGTALGIWAKSDRRLKQDIVEVGIDGATGLPIYEFSYKVLPSTRFRGVMADDVEKRYPDAVATGAHGFKTVNYSMLGIEMVEV